MNGVTRRESVKLVAGLAIGATVIVGREARGQETREAPPLDAVLRVDADINRGISLRFELPGKADQSFRSDEYRYAVLDKDGVQVNGALAQFPLAIHTTRFPKNERSISDYSAFMFDPRSLKSGEEYYLIVFVRNLTALSKFKA